MLKAHERKRIQDCLISLKEINNGLKKLSFDERQELLPLCQEMAVEIGNTIEQKEGEGTEVVCLLEKYCEEIYLLYTTAQDNNIEDFSIKIDGLIKKIDRKIQGLEILPTEILFLPYKASMWDSMESVYTAALKQENCHVTVMPIPYYNVNPAGEILDVKYEGNLFPANVNIIDFRNYDLKEMQPDTIFIHNPYDQYNYVTRVAENYFSVELVKYTSRLVYLPYFVTSRNIIQGHYCVVPAVKYAWRTFVQSEEIRKGYLQYVRREDSIIALGSPKFDKVKAVEENLNRVPDEWKKFFKNKKVFLLNTHINSIINKAEETVEKLMQIFSFFQGRNDVALLWRPHPLSLDTAKALKPDFTEKYLKLIESFKEMSVGIYDESADVHRAIAVSDGYIGNRGSVVSLYGISGKPIFIFSLQKINILEKNTNQTIEEKNREIEKAMLESAEPIRYLYYENFISMEYFVELVKAEKDFCVQERKQRFINLQYGFESDETAGERIWKYVYNHITGEENV